MNADKIKELQIPQEQKRRSGYPVAVIVFIVLAITATAAYFAWPRDKDSQRLVKKNASYQTDTAVVAAATPPTKSAATNPTTSSNSVSPAQPASSRDDSVLTVSGYIINRERIELSPRYMGTVTWIGVKKGDPVTNGQVVVLLDDAEYRARLLEADGHLSSLKVNVEKSKLDYDRIVELNKTHVESKKMEDDARLTWQAAQAAVKEAQGTYDLAKTYLDWTTIRSPINGVVLEKLVQPNELVVPQSFGGTRGPSTALIAVADPQDLQVEIDLNEADLSKAYMNQKCRISPEAYPDKSYEGHVAEIAPEADRQKGTLQLKVQIHQPDHFLTPNLSAKVDFLKKAN